MISAKAKTVAQRTLPDGVEYMFTAADQRDPEKEMTVYVTVVNGEAPVFTRVVR